MGKVVVIALSLAEGPGSWPSARRSARRSDGHRFRDGVPCRIDGLASLEADPGGHALKRAGHGQRNRGLQSERSGPLRQLPPPSRPMIAFDRSLGLERERGSEAQGHLSQHRQASRSCAAVGRDREPCGPSGRSLFLAPPAVFAQIDSFAHRGRRFSRGEERHSPRVSSRFRDGRNVPADVNPGWSSHCSPTGGFARSPKHLQHPPCSGRQPPCPLSARAKAAARSRSSPSRIVG